MSPICAGSGFRPLLAGRRRDRRGHYRIDGTNIGVRCGGIEVRPGDHVVADEDGVAVAPKERYDEVVPLATKWQADKQALVPLIQKHGSYLKAMQERDAAGPRPR